MKIEILYSSNIPNQERNDTLKRILNFLENEPIDIVEYYRDNKYHKKIRELEKEIEGLKEQIDNFNTANFELWGL